MKVINGISTLKKLGFQVIDKKEIWPHPTEANFIRDELKEKNYQVRIDEDGIVTAPAWGIVSNTLNADIRDIDKNEKDPLALRELLSDAWLCTERGKFSPDCSHATCAMVAKKKLESQKRTLEFGNTPINLNTIRDYGAEGLLRLLALAAGGYSQITDRMIEDAAKGQMNNGGMFSSTAASEKQLQKRLRFALDAYFGDNLESVDLLDLE